MAVLTANDFAQQMIAQARVLQPSFSGEVGTPERAIIDTVAQSLADNQIDLTGLQGALDVDSKFGASLDRFTALFGFQRQQPAAATGYVVFSRPTPAPATVTIPIGATVQSNASATQYTTTSSGSIAQGASSSGAMPIQAVVTGTNGNTAANTLTQIVGATPIPGVTAVTNPNALTNGFDSEDDNTYKVRFKNTWARNLAGTQDQFLALALAGTFTTKASAIGTQSRYQEYVQVPSYDDQGNLAGTNVPTQNTLGVQGAWTTALSAIPYAKQIFTNVQTYVSNGQQGAAQFFYRPGTDFQFNYPPLITGDVVRTIQTTVNGNQTVGGGGTLIVNGTQQFPTSGTLIVGGQLVTYTGLNSSPISFTGCSACTVTNNQPVYLVPASSGVRPNFTLNNVFNPNSPTTIPGLQATAPGNILLTEFSYVSSASRNDLPRNVNNAVDIYVDGSNDVQSSCVFLANATNQIFNTNAGSPWYYENYRRDGNPSKRPQIGNYITPLFQSPVDSLPNTITISGQNFYLGFHYWLIHETDSLSYSIRARDGVEWDLSLLGDLGGFPAPATPALAATYLAPYFPLGGNNISALTGSAVEVDNYQYDSNIVSLQASMESARQITTDVLVHRATMRYFKLDVTVMYSPHSNPNVVNAAIGTAVQAYLNQQYFGTVVQLSTLLEVIHEVFGVENVRWSNDLPLIPNLIRVYETDINGTPLHGTSVDRLVTGPSSTELQTLYVVGGPQGTFTLSWTDSILPGGHTMTTTPISFTDTTGTPVTAATIQTAIRAAATGLGVVSGIYNNISVALDGRPTTNVPRPITSFTITYGATGIPVLPSVSQTITSSTYAFDGDFFLQDNELPTLPQAATATDTLPGLIIRPRAENTFYRPGS